MPTGHVTSTVVTDTLRGLETWWAIPHHSSHLTAEQGNEAVKLGLAHSHQGGVCVKDAGRSQGALVPSVALS
jgi:NADPH-dependent 2,4-dienoyl-CoA reductase/sulfur reductase-like enzyme